MNNMKSAMVLCLAFALSGCGGIGLWPFGGNSTMPSQNKLLNATQYLCKGGKSFHVRMLDNGNAAWIIYPDREVRFDKAGSRYMRDASVFEFNGNQATLQDGPTVSFTDCKATDK